MFETSLGSLPWLQKGWGESSGVECLLRVHEVLKKKEKKQGKEGKNKGKKGTCQRFVVELKRKPDHRGDKGSRDLTLGNLCV